MAFWGDYFVYDGIPCTEFGLRLYEVNGVTPGEAKFSVASDISDGLKLNRMTWSRFAIAASSKN